MMILPMKSKPCENKKHTVMVESAEREGIKKRVDEMQQFLAEQKS